MVECMIQLLYRVALDRTKLHRWPWCRGSNVNTVFADLLFVAITLAQAVGEYTEKNLSPVSLERKDRPRLLGTCGGK